MLKRRQNLLGQMRVDLPHLRAMESSVSNDFDVMAGDIFAGNSPLIVRGFTLSMIGAIGSPATSLTMLVADSAIIHPGATESGSIFSTDVNASPEVLSSTNSKVEGAFTADATNFVGLDLRRAADPTTTDTVMFLDSSTGLESPESVPLAITMDYKIIISTTDFAVTPHVCPVAVVVTTGGNVSSVTDARPMIGRLAPGGSNPDEQGSFSWSQGRLDGVASSSTAFTGGDKAIRSLKGSLDAIMTRLWEIGGGERWFAATSDRDMKVTFGQPVLSNGDNFDFNSGTGVTDWASVTVTFANSTGYLNEIQDSSVVGSATLADGQCLYVDIDRTQNLTGVNGLIPQVADLLTLGSPSVPGSRLILAWRVDTQLYIRDKSYEVGRTFTVATTAAYGLVRLAYAAGGATTRVPPLDANDSVKATAAAASNAAGFIGIGDGTGSGVQGSGGAGSNGNGVRGFAAGSGQGVYGTGASTGNGVKGRGGITSGAGVYGETGNTAANSPGVYGITDHAASHGVHGKSTHVSSAGVYGENTGGGNSFLSDTGNYKAAYPAIFDVATQGAGGAAPTGDGVVFRGRKTTTGTGYGPTVALVHAAADGNDDGVALWTKKNGEDDVDLYLGGVIDAVIAPWMHFAQAASSILPETTNLWKLGSTAKRFNTVYASNVIATDGTNQIKATSTEIDFSSAVQYDQTVPTTAVDQKINSANIARCGIRCALRRTGALTWTLKGADGFNGWNVSDVEVVNSGGVYVIKVSWAQDFIDTNYIVHIDVEHDDTNQWGMFFRAAGPNFATFPKANGYAHLIPMDYTTGGVFDLNTMTLNKKVYLNITAYGAQV